MRTPRGQEDRFHATGLQQPIEGLGELRISVMEQIALAQEKSLAGVGQLSGAVLHEGGGGMRGDAGDLDTPCGQLHHHEDIVRHEPVPRRHLDCEKVRGREYLPVHLEELRPAHPALPSLWRGVHMVAAQDIAHGQLVDALSQIRQSALDASITPGGVVSRHAHDQLFDLLGDTRTSQLGTARAPIKLLGDEATVPPQERVWGNKRGDLLQAFTAERMGEHREAAAFCLGQTPLAATELGFEDAVFREEIRDDLLLVTLKPAGDQHDQDMQDHERSSDWRQWRHRRAQYTTNRGNFNSIETAENFNQTRSDAQATLGAGCTRGAPAPTASC